MTLLKLKNFSKSYEDILKIAGSGNDRVSCSFKFWILTRNGIQLTLRLCTGCENWWMKKSRENGLFSHAQVLGKQENAVCAFRRFFVHFAISSKIVSSDIWIVSKRTKAALEDRRNHTEHHSSNGSSQIENLRSLIRLWETVFNIVDIAVIVSCWIGLKSLLLFS